VETLGHCGSLYPPRRLALLRADGMAPASSHATISDLQVRSKEVICANSGNCRRIVCRSSCTTKAPRTLVKLRQLSSIVIISLFPPFLSIILRLPFRLASLFLKPGPQRDGLHAQRPHTDRICPNVARRKDSGQAGPDGASDAWKGASSWCSSC